jgi:hypothetical protein
MQRDRGCIKIKIALIYVFQDGGRWAVIKVNLYDDIVLGRCSGTGAMRELYRNKRRFIV